MVSNVIYLLKYPAMKKLNTYWEDKLDLLVVAAYQY